MKWTGGADWRRRRQNAGFTMAEIAEIAGISKPALSFLERNINGPKRDTRLRVNHALELAEAWHREELDKQPSLSLEASPVPTPEPVRAPVVVVPAPRPKPTPPPPKTRAQRRAEQLARCSRGVRPQLHDNYRAERTLLAPDWAPMVRRPRERMGKL